MLVFAPRLAMIEQERRDRELALRLAQDPDAVDTEAAQQVPKSPLQRYADNFISLSIHLFRVVAFFFPPRSRGSNIDILSREWDITGCDCTIAGISRKFCSSSNRVDLNRNTLLPERKT